MNTSSSNRVTIVTGAAAGIGRVTALRLLGDGERVMASDVDEVGLARLEDESAADRLAVQPCDVGDRSGCEALVAATERHFGRVTGLVNSAGITPRSLGPELEFEARWDTVMRVNLKGTVMMCHAAVPAIERAGGGAIVNLASIMSFVVHHHTLPLSDGFNPYSHGKGAVAQVTRDLGVRVAGRGIRVNAVCPGFVHTGLTEGLSDQPELYESIRAMHPAGRFGEPAEIAAVIRFLLSDEASFVNAATWVVDGGYTAV